MPWRPTSSTPKPKRDWQADALKRGTSAERLYGWKWHKASRAFLVINPLCKRCEQRGHATPANTVHHNPPHNGNLNLFWDESTWEAICPPCHARVREDKVRKSLRIDKGRQ